MPLSISPSPPAGGAALPASIAALVVPLPGETPCGADLSFAPAFDTLKELRREDDPTLDQGEWKTELKTADWPGVERLCTVLLTRQTKDLRVAGWWTEAVTHQRSFAGLAEGLQLCAALLQDQWAGVHPQADDGEWDQRVGALRWLLGRVEDLAGRATVLKLGRRAMGLVDIDAARPRAAQAAAHTDGAAPAASEAAPTIEAFYRAIASAGTAAFDALVADARAARAALGALERVVDERLGQEGPAFAAPRKALDDAIDRLLRLGRAAGLGVADPQDSGDIGDTPVSGATASPGGGGQAGPLLTRAQALQQLREVAAFFRRTEPHSPVAYLADKAARWGDMPLHAWLRTVMKDGTSLAQLEEMLGIESSEPPSLG